MQGVISKNHQVFPIALPVCIWVPQVRGHARRDGAHADQGDRVAGPEIDRRVGPVGRRRLDIGDVGEGEEPADVDLVGAGGEARDRVVAGPEIDPARGVARGERDRIRRGAADERLDVRDRDRVGEVAEDQAVGSGQQVDVARGVGHRQRHRHDLNNRKRCLRHTVEPAIWPQALEHFFVNRVTGTPLAVLDTRP